MPKVSVIIPVYNTQEYLRKCLDSVIGQSLKDIEIICVDDGSTDTSPDILEEYARADARIKVIHRPNGGLVSARKAGIAAATGTCTGYVASEDWIESDMYEKLCGLMEEKQTGLVTCGYFLEGSYTTSHLDTVDGGLYGAEDMGYLRDHAIYRMECRETGLRGGLWCKLFLTGKLKSAQLEIPDEISIAEDKVCLLRYLLDCSSVYVLKEPLYHWVIRQSSMSRESKKPQNAYLVKVHYVYQYLRSLYVHANFTEEMRFQAEVYITELIFLGINKRMGFQHKNMLWIDPYWMDKIPQNAGIVLYGAGELAEKYKAQLCSRPDIRLLAVIGGTEKKKICMDAEINSLGFVKYDYIIITIKNREKAEDIRKKLTERGIPENKIIWCEQPEAYWRYIEAERGTGNGVDQAGGPGSI